MAIDQISSGLIKDNAVTTAKINNDAVTGAKIVAGAVDADIQNNAVTSAKIPAGAIEIASGSVAEPKFPPSGIDKLPAIAKLLEPFAPVTASSLMTPVVI